VEPRARPGSAEILVDRVRDIIIPKKTTSAEWLGIMREAHRLGMSTTATMMYGHVETLGGAYGYVSDEARGFGGWSCEPPSGRRSTRFRHDLAQLRGGRRPTLSHDVERRIPVSMG